MDTNTTATEPRGGSRSIWLAGAIVAIVLALVAAAALIVSGDREDAVYPPDSPEAAFQGYAQAWDEGDTDTAWSVLTSSAQGRVSRRDFREANTWRDEEGYRIWIDDRSGTDERAVLHLTIETIYDAGLIGSGRYEESSRVTMVREDGEWKIDTPLVGYHRW